MESLPRLRRSLRDGESFVEFVAWSSDAIASLNTQFIAGIGECRKHESIGGPCVGKLGTIYTSGGGVIVTRHRYSELIELVCPLTDELDY